MSRTTVYINGFNFYHRAVTGTSTTAPSRAPVQVVGPAVVCWEVAPERRHRCRSVLHRAYVRRVRRAPGDLLARVASADPSHIHEGTFKMREKKGKLVPSGHPATVVAPEVKGPFPRRGWGEFREESWGWGEFQGKFQPYFRRLRWLCNLVTCCNGAREGNRTPYLLITSAIQTVRRFTSRHVVAGHDRCIVRRDSPNPASIGESGGRLADAPAPNIG